MGRDAVIKFLNSVRGHIEQLDIFDPCQLYRSDIYIGIPIHMCTTRVSPSNEIVYIKDLSYIRKVDGEIQYIDTSLRSSKLAFDFQLENNSSSTVWSEIINNFSARLELDNHSPPTIHDDVLQWEKSDEGTGNLKLADREVIYEDISPEQAVNESIHEHIYEVLPEYGSLTSNPYLQKQIYDTEEYREIVSDELDDG